MKSSISTGSTLLALLLTFAAAFSVQASTGFTPADEQGRANYLVTFAEPGLLAQHKQRSTGQRFDFNAPSNSQAREQLQAQQAQHLSRMASTLGRNVEPSHFYLVTHSGVAARLSQEEARRVRALPGVISIERERVYELSTYRGPTFIGADGIWTGSSTPSGAEFEGRGMVAGVLDTGIVPTHASFINDPACGHGTTFPNKVLSSLDCASTDGLGLCNGASPTDTNGHGSHTASTVAGNRVQSGASPSPTIPSPYTEISGVAPCAHVRSYKTCPGQSCPGADLQAGLNSVLIHGDIDSVNYSISGGTNPWADFDRIKLDMVDEGMFVAASAGNTNASITNPVGQVNHRGPWVTTVAASTRDGSFTGEVTVDGNTYAADPGSASPVGSNLTGHPIRYDAAQPAGADGCNSSGGFPADFFAGSIALIQRGSCNFSEKINNAAAAGADMVLVWNNAAGGFGMSTPGQDPNTPAYSITQAAGNAIRAYIDAQGAAAVADFAAIPSQGDVLANFSFRGPTPGALANLQKPDITAPGVDIYAAVPGGYASISGTSMSGPHVAGAGLLVAQVKPDWTPSEIKSAIQMTASKAGTKENGTTSWDWDDVGHGRADLMGAALAGFVLDETTAAYIAANPATGGDVRTLNLAGLRDVDCSPSCTWTRTVRNTLDTASSWTAAGAGITANMNITVSPSSFSFTGDPNETQELTITAAPVDDLTSTIGFGEIIFEEAADLSPDLHFTVAIRGEPSQVDIPTIDIDQSEFFFVMNPDSSETQVLSISNVGSQPLEWVINEAEQGIAARSGHNPDLDEALSLDDFLLPGSGAHNTTATGGVTSNGDVIGFTFTGTVAGISGNGTWASDAQLNMTSPDSQSYQVGGFGGDNPWAFDGEGSTNDGTYTSTHLGAFTDAQDAGTWEFGFVHTWNDPMNWSDVTITLHKTGVSGPCADPSDIPWLSVLPTSGTTAAGAADDVDVIVDSTGLLAGQYDALLCLSSNDPNNGLIEIPVSLTVVDGTIEPATIGVDVASFSFDLISGESDSDNMVISNIGDELLSWNITTAEAASGNFPSGANIVVFDDVNFSPNADGTGGSVQWHTGDTCNCDTAPYNFNVWASGGNMAFWWPGSVTRGAVSDGSGYVVMEPGQTVGAGSNFATSGSTMPWRQAGNVDGYLGFRFVNPDTSVVNYGYARMTTTGTTGYPATIVGWAYDQTGASITIPEASVPEACDNPANISWLNASPASGVLAGGNSATVTVSVDSTGLAGGIYEALVCVNSNDAANPIVEIPVTLDVSQPPTAANLEGTVSSLGYCSADPFAAAGASIEVTGDSGTVYTATADAAGFYQLVLDVNESPISVTASAPDHASATEVGVTLIVQDTVTVDFDLVLEAACATVEPGSLSVGLLPDQTAAESIEIGNLQGAADLVWTVFTEEVGSRAHFPEVPYFVAPGMTEGASALADESATHGGGSLSFEFPLGTALEAFSTTGFTADGYVSLDPLVPGTLNLINATQPTNIFAATFIDNDFSRQYMLASANGTVPANTFGFADTDTGVFTALGTVTGGGAGSWSSMKWDHATGTLYAVNAAGGNNVLYTIDPDSLVASQVGVISGAGVDPGAIVIAIAISPNGLMYGIDIIADALLAVDKETAEAAVIGALGVNANFAQDMDFDNSDGTLYWAGYLGGGNSQMFTVDLTTGAATAIGNIGGGNELLSFTIASQGAGGACQAPSSISWMTVDPTAGTTEAGSTDTIDVLFDSTGLSNGVYEAFVCIETNDANNAQIAVPVSLNVVVDELFQDRFEQ